MGQMGAIVASDNFIDCFARGEQAENEGYIDARVFERRLLATHADGANDVLAEWIVVIMFVTDYFAHKFDFLSLCCHTEIIQGAKDHLNKVMIVYETGSVFSSNVGNAG